MSDWKHIQTAYEQAAPLYRNAWALDKAKAMHYGYWDDTTKNLPQALHRLNERLAELAKPPQNGNFLDAGCGVGGTALFLGKKYAGKVLGISLSEKEVQQARAYAQKADLNNALQFEVGNYLSIPAEADSFDQVWAVESLFHCSDKPAFLEEVRRVLRPGGRLVLADYYEHRQKISQSMLRWMKEWRAGYAIPQLSTWEGFQRQAQKAGFVLQAEEDASKAVMPSSKRLARWGRLGLVYLKLFGWLHPRLFPQYPLDKVQIRATVSQYKALRSRCWSYRLSVWELGE